MNKLHKQTILKVPERLKPSKIRAIYSIYSQLYWLLAPLEEKARSASVEKARITPTDKVLEVAVGTGYTFVELLKRTLHVTGVDLTPAMLEKTRNVAAKSGYPNVSLIEADARKLPFEDETYNVVINNFMLDLIPENEFNRILTEMMRVLKPNGRLVLVNLSKPDGGKRHLGANLIEKIYELSPEFLGGCRPVLMKGYVSEVGFREVSREFGSCCGWPYEIVTAKK